MIIVLSPAKKQAAPGRAGVTSACTQHSAPRFLNEANELRTILSGLSEEELRALFRLSEKKAAEVHALYHGSAPTGPAVGLFGGVAFASLLSSPVPSEACPIWQRHLRILSGLYGYLCPFDRIEGYRLDLEDRIPGVPTDNLYAFWREKVTDALLSESSLSVSATILDLASKEYSDLLDWDRIRSEGVRRVAADFLTESGGKRKRVSVHAKQGRGAVARYVLNELSSYRTLPSGHRLHRCLEKFRGAGFEYSQGGGEDVVFLRRG